MADQMEDRAARLRGRKKAPNTAALVTVALVTGLGAGGLGGYYWLSQDRMDSGPVRDTSESREFQRNGNTGLNPVVSPSFAPTETGPSATELALRSRVAELERILLEARNQQPADPVVDTAQIEQLQTQLDGLKDEMLNREAEMSNLKTERDDLSRKAKRREAEMAGLLDRLDQANNQSLEEQQLAEAQRRRQQELERRRSEAQAIAKAQINSPINGLSGGSSDDGGREYVGEEAFVRSGADAIRVTQSRIIGAPSNTVTQGTVIEATLTTGINSQLSGTISSTVSYDIWSFDMAQVLIPRGSQMFGRYSNEVALGQKRVLVAWDRLVTPDGQVVDLDAYGADRLGRSGLTGRVNNRFGQRFGAAALVSIFTALPAIAAAHAEDGPEAEIVESLGEDASDNATSVIEEYIALAPIITVEHGDVIMVMVTNDLELY